MFTTIITTGLAEVIALVLAASAIVLTARWSAGREHLMVAFGVGGVGIASLVAFVAFWLKPVVGTMFCFALVGASLVVLGRARAWIHWRRALPLVVVTAGITLVYLGFLYLWQIPANGYFLVIRRFSELDLPPDSLIPAIFSDRIATGSSTTLVIGDWNGADRPPLESGFLLLTRPFVQPFNDGWFGSSIAAQMLWVPALFALLRAIRGTRLMALLVVLACAAAGTSMINSIYTWPKMMCAAFILCACAFLIDSIRRPGAFRRDFVFAVVCSVLGVLTHGAAIFSIPLLVALSLVAFLKQSRRESFAAVGIGAGVGILVFLPWFFYQVLSGKPSDRLLKWHLAGVTSASDHRSLFQALVDSYHSITFWDWIRGRVDNFFTVFQNPFTGSGSVLARRLDEFHLTTTALSVSSIAIIAIVAVILVSSLRGRPLDGYDRQFFALVASSVLCILIWCIVMFRPASTSVHQGSQVWIFLLFAAPASWLVAKHRRLFYALLSAQAIEFVVVYFPVEFSAPLNPGGVILACAGIALCVASVLVLRRQLPVKKPATKRLSQARA